MTKKDWKFLGGLALTVGVIAAVVKAFSPDQKCRSCDVALKVANAVSLICPTCHAIYPKI